MKFFDKKAMTIIEVMVSLLIITVGIVGIYTIYNKSQRLSVSTENRIIAVSIAREGLEIIQNIRDSNWRTFSVDTENCWNVLNYKNGCLGNSTVEKINQDNDVHYIVYKNFGTGTENDDRWYLKQISVNGDYSNEEYREAYLVQKFSTGIYEGLYVQGCENCNDVEDTKPLFTREIIISKAPKGNSTFYEKDEAFLAKVIVSRSDNAKSGISKIELESVITNW